MHEMNSGHVGHAVHSGSGGSVVAAARKSKFTACGRTDGRPPCGTRLGRATGVRRSAWTVALVLAAMATFAAGAPMTFEASHVADPVRSLQPVDQLFLQVSWAGDDLGTIGLSPATIREAITERCAEAEIEIIEEDSRDLPVLHLQAIVLAEDSVPDAVAYEFRLSVNQFVRLEGVDDALRVPTYFIVYTGLEHRNDVQRFAGRNMRMLISRFLQERTMTRGS